MKAIVSPQAGAQDALTLMDVPVPQIDPEEVLVRTQAIGVGVHDRWFMPEDANFPYPVGIEASGTVSKIGRAVTRFESGDRIMFASSMQPKGGVWAEFAAVSEQALVRIPNDLDFVRAAALPVAGGTAVRALRLLDPGASDTKTELAQLATEVAAGRIHVEVERVFPFEQGVAALEKTETRHARGKLVLTLA